MISMQELDSVLLSEASREALARKLNPKPKLATYPDWEYCGKHGMWFCFRCARCSGDLVYFGGL